MNAKPFFGAVETLSAFRWDYRLVVGSIDEKSEMARLDEAVRSNLVEIRDRKLLFLILYGDELRVLGDAGSVELGESSKNEIRAKLEGSSFALIGLDGGVKQSFPGGAFRMQSVYELIDSMPMRRAELRKRSREVSQSKRPELAGKRKAGLSGQMIAESKIFPDHATKDPSERREGIESHDPRFDELVVPGAKVERHWKGAEWSEGPVYLPQKNVVIWSDIPNNRMLQFDPSSGETTVFRDPSNFSNGNYTDLEGRLVSAQHLTHGITRTEHDGSVTMLIDNVDGKRFNSPNDLVVKSDGSIWFTDPPYGILSDREGKQRKSDIGGNYVYRFHPDTKELTVVIDCMDRPNGLAFSPDEKRLYVADTGKPRNMVVWDVDETGATVSNKRDFLKLEPGVSDGFRCDVKGYIWTSAGDGIHCYTAEAELLGKILIPEVKTANCCFGGPDFKTLYIAGDTSLYSVKLAVAGARPQDLR